MELLSSPRAAASPSYEEFVAARSGVLYRSAYLMTGKQADAEDLLQTTLVKLYLGWKKASSADSVEAYARRIMINTLISGRRPRRWHRERLVCELPDSPSVDRSPDDHLELWPLVRRLPPRQRAVVVLRYYEGLSEREIADLLNIAPGTVKSSCSAALRSLRGHLEHIPTVDARIRRGDN
ncbi:MAG: SigE family RNA polymerase sigma factor [Nocardioides sp.]